MSFVTLWGFLGNTSGKRITGRAIKRAGEIKIEEYTGNTAATIVDPVLIVESEVN